MTIRRDPHRDFGYDYSDASLDEVIEQLAEINGEYGDALETLETANEALEELGLSGPIPSANFVSIAVVNFQSLSEQFTKILFELEHEIKREHIRRLERAPETIRRIGEEVDKDAAIILERAHPAIRNARQLILEYGVTLAEELYGLPERLRELLKSQVFSAKTVPGQKAGRFTPIYKLGTKSWTVVKIEFISQEEVRVSVGPEFLVNKNYRELGFDRKNGHPKLIWKTLLYLARANGRLHIFDGQITEKERQKLRKHISDLRKHLKRLFNTSQDPFRRTEEARCYASKFVIFEQETVEPNETIALYEEDIQRLEKWDPKGIRRQHLKEINKNKKR